MEARDRLSMLGWGEAAAFLRGPGLDRPAIVETHTAVIHLTPSEAWKLRRPVDYGWLDYGSRAKRRACAAREIALNAPAASGLYLGLGGVDVSPQGGLRLLRPAADPDGLPATAEPLVVMRRFAADALFSQMAEAGKLDRRLLAQTGARVAALHKAAPAAGAVDLAALVGAEAAEIARLGPVLGADLAAALAEALLAEAARRTEVATARHRRRCHGDLHLGNIVLWRGQPAPFDCIEFNDAIATVDPLYDLAFLTMDLRIRGLGGLRPAVLNAWAEALSRTPDPLVETAYGGLALLGLYEAVRASIRAKVTVLQGRPDQACAYAEAALATLRAPPTPRLIAVGGRSGTGKSTLARALADRLQAVVLRSDAVRKGLLGVEETARLPQAAYAADISAQVAQAMRLRAAMALNGGWPVILDATHLEASQRAEAAALAGELGLRFDGLWLDAPRAVLETRIAARRDDASDATLAVLARQMTQSAPEDWVHLCAQGAPDGLAARALAALC
ncbi:MAG: AAA family ATPase [Pikeienuella sp.]